MAVPAAHLHHAEGSVAHAPQGDKEWHDVQPRRVLKRGDRLWIDRGSRAEVQAGGHALRLNGETQLVLENVGETATQLSLTQGNVVATVTRMNPGDSFEVGTPNLAFRARQPGDYRIDVDTRQGVTRVAVLSGSGVVYGERGEALEVRNGQRMTFKDRSLARVQQAAFAATDDFDRWAAARRRGEPTVSMPNVAAAAPATPAPHTGLVNKGRDIVIAGPASSLPGARPAAAAPLQAAQAKPQLAPAPQLAKAQPIPHAQVPPNAPAAVPLRVTAPGADAPAAASQGAAAARAAAAAKAAREEQQQRQRAAQLQRAEEERRSAAADARRAEERKRATAARQAEDERRQAQARRDRGQDPKRALAGKRAEEERRAVQAKRAAEEKKLAAARKAEAQKVAETRRRQLARLQEQAEREEQTAQARREQQARRAEEERREEQARREEQYRREEQARRDEAYRRERALAEQQRREYERREQEVWLRQQQYQQPYPQYQPVRPAPMGVPARRVS